MRVFGRRARAPEGAPAVPVIPGYRDLQLIGSGGFSKVYTAHQERFARTVAVKVVTVELSDSALRRLAREQATAGQLDGHPHVIRVYESGTTDHGQPYMTMEYHGEGSYADRLRWRGPLPLGEVLDAGVKLASALAAAHGRGIVHRDVKPQNVLVSPFVGPVLSDFGIAVVDTARLHTTSEAFTALHVAPEVLDGEPATYSSDLYSLMSTLYELLAGSAPFAGTGDSGLLELMRRVRTEPMPLVQRADVPRDVAQALAGLMDRSPHLRPAHAPALAEHLQDLQRHIGVPATPDPQQAGAPGAGQVVVTGVVGAPPPDGLDATPIQEEDTSDRPPAPFAPGPTPAPGLPSDPATFDAPDPATPSKATPQQAGSPSQDVTSDHVRLSRPPVTPSEGAEGAAPGHPVQAGPPAPVQASEPGPGPLVAGDPGADGPLLPPVVPPRPEPDSGTSTGDSHTRDFVPRPPRPDPLVAPATGKRRWRVPAIVGSVLLLALGGVAAWWFVIRDEGQEEVVAPKPAAEPEEDGDAVPLADCPGPATDSLPDLPLQSGQPPTWLEVEQSGDGTAATLRWDDPSGGAGTFVVFQLCVDAEGDEDQVPLGVVVAPAPTEVTYDGLSLDHNYCYTVSVLEPDGSATPYEADDGTHFLCLDASTR